MDIDRIMRMLFIGVLAAVVYTLSKPLTLVVLAAIGVLIVVIRLRQLRDERSRDAI